MVLVVVISIAVVVGAVVGILGCLNCFFRKKQNFTTFSNSNSVNDISNAQHIDAFTVDIDESPADSSTVTIERMPDIIGKVSSAPPSRPKIKCVARGSQAFASLSAGQRSFRRDQLTYLNEIGSGWFGQAIESEASKITAGSLKSQVVVKMLKDDASKAEQTQFMDEIIAFRCVEHTNVMRLLGQCTEATPYLVILEYAYNGNLKSYFSNHKGHVDTLIKKNVLMKFALDSAAGLTCLHRHDFVHCDIAARNCLVMSDLTVKIGDYGVAETLFKEDYFDSGSELLPIRWMAPETLIQTEGVWTSQSYDKLSDMWSFGILLWEIFSLGEQPYEVYSDEAVLQGVVLDRLVAPADLSARIPHREKLTHLMASLLQDPNQRLNIEDTHRYLGQLSTEAPTRVSTILADGSDFDEKWNHLGLNDKRTYSVASEADSNIGLAGSLQTDNFLIEGRYGSDFDEKWNHLGLNDKRTYSVASEADSNIGLAGSLQTDNFLIEDQRPSVSGEMLPDVNGKLTAEPSHDFEISTDPQDTTIRGHPDMSALPQMQVTVEDESGRKEIKSPDFSHTLKLTDQEMTTSTPIINRDNGHIVPEPSANGEFGKDSLNDGKEPETLDSRGFDFTDFVSSEPEEKTELSGTENTNLEAMKIEKNVEGLDSSGFEFTEFVSGEALEDKSNVQKGAEPSVPSIDIAPTDLPKDVDAKSDSVILINTEMKSNEGSSSGNDESILSLDEPALGDQTAEMNVSDKNPVEWTGTDGHNVVDTTDASLFSLSSNPDSLTPSNVDTTSPGNNPFSLLDSVPSTQMQSENAFSNQFPVQASEKSDDQGALPSLPSLSSDFELLDVPPSQGQGQVSSLDLLAPLTDEEANQSPPSKDGMSSPSQVLEEAGKDLQDAMGNGVEPLSSIEFLGDMPSSSPDSSKPLEGSEESASVSEKVGNHSKSDESDETINPDKGEDENTDAYVMLNSDSASDTPSPRRNLEISAEELSKIFLESSNFKLSPTKTHGPNLYRSNHIDLRESQEGSVSVENGIEDFVERLHALGGLPTAPCASPVESDCEETSETSSTSGSGKEYSCVSPLDTGQPPPTPLPDIDHDKENLDPASPTKASLTSDSDLTGDNLINIREFYLSKGTKSPRVFEVPPLETIPEHQLLHFTSGSQKSSSLSDSSSVEVKYEDLFGSDYYEWDDFYGDSLVTDMNEDESHIQYSHLSNPKLNDWSLSFDSDSHPNLSSVQSSILTHIPAASASVCSANEKTNIDSQNPYRLSDSELSEQESSSGLSLKSSFVTGVLARQPKLSTLTNVSVFSSDRNSTASYLSLSEDYEVHLGSPLGSSPASGMDDDQNCSPPISSPSQSYPSSPSLAPPTGRVIPEGHPDDFGSDPVSTPNTQEPGETGQSSNSSFDLLGLDLTSSPGSPASGNESTSQSHDAERPEPDTADGTKEERSLSLL